MPKKQKTNDQTLQIRIPSALHEQLKVVAESLYMPVSVMTRLALADYVRNHATTALAQITTPHNQHSKPQKQAPINPAQRMYDSWTPEQQRDYDETWG